MRVIPIKLWWQYGCASPGLKSPPASELSRARPSALEEQRRFYAGLIGLIHAEYNGETVMPGCKNDAKGSPLAKIGFPNAAGAHAMLVLDEAA